MKNAVALIVLLGAILAAGYFGLPVLFEREATGIRSDIREIQKRVEKVEEFIKSEEELRKQAYIAPDADFPTVVKSVNALSTRIIAVEDAVHQKISERDTIMRQGASTEDALKEKTESLDKISKDVQTKIQKLTFTSLLENIRGHALKVKLDLVSKNIGTAKNELEGLSGALHKAKELAPEGSREAIEELQGILGKARAEIDTDLQGAVNRVDIIWHDTGKILKAL